MMRGRLASVGFAGKVDPSRQVLRLQFVLDESYAWIPRREDEVGQRVPAVVTDWPIADLGGLNADNYVKTIESMLPKDVHLGGSYLVIATWPVAYGMELHSIEPATPESESRFVKEHKAEMLNARRYWHEAMLGSTRSVLEMKMREITKLTAESDKLDASHKEGMVTMLADLKARFEVAKQESIERIKERLAGLHDERLASTDEQTNSALDSMIQTSEQAIPLIESLGVPQSP